MKRLTLIPGDLIEFDGPGKVKSLTLHASRRARWVARVLGVRVFVDLTFTEEKAHNGFSEMWRRFKEGPTL